MPLHFNCRKGTALWICDLPLTVHMLRTGGQAFQLMVLQ